MGAKIKPSVKEYKRDARGKMTKQWTWKHFNVESISTKELKEFYSSPSYKRKKEAIRLELVKRNAV
jgi:hypothetical protein